jgi:hypothetical protein
MLPHAALQISTFPNFAKLVYGDEFYSSMPLATASAVLTGSSAVWNATGGMLLEVVLKHFMLHKTSIFG